MKRIANTDEDIFFEVVQTCQEFEKVLPDSVCYRIFEYYSLESSEPIPFVSFSFDDHLELMKLVAFLQREEKNTPDVIEIETRAGWGEPVILCEAMGDCRKGFDFLLENYPPWQKYKIHAREEKRIGQPIKKQPPEAL
jgi:hypothetical protein